MTGSLQLFIVTLTGWIIRLQKKPQVKQSELFDNINVRITEAVNYYENRKPLVYCWVMSKHMQLTGPPTGGVTGAFCPGPQPERGPMKQGRMEGVSIAGVSGNPSGFYTVLETLRN